MGKQNNGKDLTVFTGLSQDFKSQAADLLNAFEKVEAKDLQQLNAEYLKLEPKKSYGFIFNGMTTMTNNEGEELEVVVLVDKEANTFISGLTLLVNNLKKCTDIPCMVKVNTKEMVKTKNGSYQDMDIYTVPMPLAK